MNKNENKEKAEPVSKDEHPEDATEIHAIEITSDHKIIEQRVPILTVLAGGDAGMALRLPDKRFTMGRDRDCDLFLSDPGLSRQHVSLEPISSGSYVLHDLFSTNGTFVNGQKVSEITLRDDDTIHIGPVVIINFSYVTEAELNLRIQQHDQAVRDQLTSLYNRRYLQMALHREIAYAVRYQEKLSFVIFDIDHFKVINDTHGHPAGDAVLHQLATSVTGQLRKDDIFARYGGEEFAIILRGLDADLAFQLCERIRLFIEKLRIPFQEKELDVTISLGLASYELKEDLDADEQAEPSDTDIILNKTGESLDPDELIALADANLYKAKQGGRNRTVGP